MRTNDLFRPTYKFQIQRQKQIWHPVVAWQSERGRCLAIAKYPSDTFYVLLERQGKARWLPVEQVLTESEVKQWIHSTKINGGERA